MVGCEGAAAGTGAVGVGTSLSPPAVSEEKATSFVGLSSRDDNDEIPSLSRLPFCLSEDACGVVAAAAGFAAVAGVAAFLLRNPFPKPLPKDDDDGSPSRPRPSGALRVQGESHQSEPVSSYQP